MSYCRKGKNLDIYLYGDISKNEICCFFCCLESKPMVNVFFKTRTSVITHLIKHRHAKHRAPYKKVISRLKDEIKEEGNIVDYSKILEDAKAESVLYNYIMKPLRSLFRWS